MSKNSNLHSAKSAKNDEFYTQLTDIEKELRHYKEQFEGKTVFLNCDDPEESNFWKFFSLQFDNYKLKRLIATHYDSTKPTYMLEKIRKEDGTVEQNKKTLTQNGDFRSPECVALLDECDIVVTNPPFSLFREYIALLMEHEKKFLVIGNMNAITYKEIFPLIKENKMWLGASLRGTKCSFLVPDSYEGDNVFYEDGVRKARVNNAIWFTNLDLHKRHEKLILWKRYIPEEFPKYDNYDAIDVDRVANIPCDYYDEIGVPITFLVDYCPEQFEIIGGFNGHNCPDEEGGYVHSTIAEYIDKKSGKIKIWNGPTINKGTTYYRILIRRKTNI